MVTLRRIAAAVGLEKTAAKMFGKSHPHDGSRIAGVDYTEGQAIERMVFICGLHRSGTTLLERLLAAEYEVSYLRANVPESEGQHMQSVYPPAVQYGGPGKFAFNREFAEILDTLTDYDAHRASILSDWQRFLVGGSPVLLEKSPPNLTKIAWLRRVFPGSRFVVMCRDPRAVAGATQKWSGSSLPELLMHWNAAYSRALDDMRDEDCMVLRYEDLVADPEGELSRIATGLELKPRLQSGTLEKRHRELKDSNAKYLEKQTAIYAGRGVWREFEYEF